MFGDSLIESSGTKKPTKAWMTVPISFLAHAIILILLVVVPLMTADSNLPEVKVMNVFLSSTPPPPPPPPPPAAKKKSSSKSKKKEDQQKIENKPIMTGRLVAPIEIPEEIQEEDISDLGLDEGIEGGVEGGVEGGIVGGVLGSPGSSDMSNLNVTRVKEPNLIKRVKPLYPPLALRSRIQANVVIEAVTDIYGRVKHARVVSGHPLLNQAALNAIYKWVYEPYIFNGIPKPVRFTVVVKFNLQRQ